MKSLIRALAAILCVCLAAPAIATDDGERQKIEGVVHDYLMSHPEVLEDALKELGERKQAEADKRRHDVLASRGGDIAGSGIHGVLGDRNGDVTLVEFFDYNCGFCRKAIKTVDALVDADPKLKVVLFDLPVIRQESVGAARVSIALAAIAPDKFRAFHEKLLGAQSVVTEERALAAATELGLDATALKSAADNPDVRSALLEAKSFADELGVEATPTFVVGDAVVVNSGDVIDQLRDRIAAVRKCGKTACG